MFQGYCHLCIWRVTINYANSVEDMKSPKEDYEIRKGVALDSGTREDLLMLLFLYSSRYLLFIYI